MAVPHFDRTKESANLSTSERFVLLVGRPAFSHTHICTYGYEWIRMDTYGYVWTQTTLVLFPIHQTYEACYVLVGGIASHPEVAIKSSTLPCDSPFTAVLMEFFLSLASSFLINV